MTVEPHALPGGHSTRHFHSDNGGCQAAGYDEACAALPGQVPAGRESAPKGTSPRSCGTPRVRGGTVVPCPAEVSRAQGKPKQGRQGMRPYSSADDGVGGGSPVEFAGGDERRRHFGRNRRTASDPAPPAGAQASRKSTGSRGKFSSLNFPSISSPREAAVAAVTCCGSRRTVDTAERLVLPPRRAHCVGSTGRLGYVHRQEAIATWTVALGGVLGLPLIVSCAYALLLSLEAEGMDAAAQVKLPWLQLSAVSAIGITFVIVASRAWLRWPARSSSAFCVQLMAAMLCVAITAGHLHAAHHAALVVDNAEPGQPLVAGAAGSVQCVALDPDDLVGGFCDVSNRVVAVPIGPNGTMLAEVDARLRGLLQASHAAVSASLLLIGERASKDVVDRCVNDGLLPWLCESALPTCSSSCSPMKPCRSRCSDVRDKCPFLVDELQQFVLPDGVLDAIVEPVVRRKVSVAAVFTGLLSCDDVERWSTDKCSAAEPAAVAASTPRGLCGALLQSTGASTGESAASGPQTWRWAAVLAISASTISSFVVVAALFCGEFVPVPCMLRRKRHEQASCSGTLPDGDFNKGSVHATVPPTSVSWGYSESTMLGSSSMSDMGSPSSSASQGEQALPHAADFNAFLEVRTPADCTDHDCDQHLPVSPVAGPAGAARRRVLSPVNEQAPEILTKSPRQLDYFSRSVLALKSPAVLLRRDGGFKRGEHGRVRSASTSSREPSGVDDDNSTESKPDDIETRLLNPSVRHVLDYRNIVAAVVLGCSGACLLRLGHVAECAGDTGSATAFVVTAVVSIGVSITSLIDWRFIYAEGVSVYRHGERRYQRMRAADTVSFAARVRFRLLWLRARWRELFGVRGQYFKQRLICTEVVEVIVQVVGLRDRFDAAGNSEIVFVVSLLVFNVTGAAVLHSRDSTAHSAEVSLLFELVCDVAFLVHLAVVVSSATVTTTPAQVVGLLVPAVVTLIAIRTLNRVVIMDRAGSDAADAGVVKHLGATRVNSLRHFRSMPAVPAPSEASAFRNSVVVGIIEEGIPTCSGPSLLCCCKAYVWVLFLVVLPVAFATLLRLVVADATCAAEVGPLWAGVTAQAKRSLAGGFFSEPLCQVDTLTHLDLRDADIQEIGEDVLQFTALQEIDARGNKELLHVSAAVVKLPALEQLRLDGTAAARHMLWGSANLSTFPIILRTVSELELLDLSDNHISAIGNGDVAALGSLHTLILSNNELSALPDRLGTHDSLRVLLASNNSISKVSDDLAPLIRRLDALDLSNNRLTELPSALGSCVFHYLNLAGNVVTELQWGASGITAVPNAIFDLPLRTLILSENGLRDIPAEIRRLSQLEYLDISHNALTALPEGVEQLQNLRTLIAHTNYFNDAAASSVWDLPKLESADFACCALFSVPDSVWSSLTLQHLDLSFNPLRSSDMSRVAAGLVTSPLRSLNLQSTRVDDVPVVLLDAALHDTLQGVVLPVQVGRVDPDGVKTLGLPCSFEGDGTAEVLRCGTVPTNMPRTNVRASCAFGRAP